MNSDKDRLEFIARRKALRSNEMECIHDAEYSVSVTNRLAKQLKMVAAFKRLAKEFLDIDAEDEAEAMMITSIRFKKIYHKKSGEINKDGV